MSVFDSYSNNMQIVPCIVDTTDNEIYVLSTDGSTRVNSFHLHHVQIDLDSSRAKLCFGTNYYGLKQKFSAATKTLVGPNHEPRNPITNRVANYSDKSLSNNYYFILWLHYSLAIIGCEKDPKLNGSDPSKMDGSKSATSP